MADIYIYPNTIRVVKVTGAQVREWLERSAGIYNQIDVAKGGEQEHDQPEIPGLQFRRDRRRAVQDRSDASLALRRYGKVVNAGCAPHQGPDYNGKAVTDDQHSSS